ncbi:hypothetical protein [Nereida sp. MMG025]|uniref:hypothetical protein n=1 Tax=Nereida sp. MMG025 TaxID=2909981 RepID=UPI001F490B9E|nr:hypothetical protein [Nereida sp. MMG025]MCF6443448.1 hypothetical protein [Nereida sp. MMG025]
MRVWIRRGALLVWPIALILYLFARPILAGLFPPMFGLQRIAPSVWTDTTDPQIHQRLVTMVAASHARVDRLFGEVSSAARVLICTSDACSARLGAQGPRGIAYGTFVIKLAPRGVDAIIVTHELTHIARRRTVLGPLRYPTLWREEGIAEWVAKGPAPSTCTVTKELPQGYSDRHMWRNDLDLYAQSHCAISTLIRAQGADQVLLN